MDKEIYPVRSSTGNRFQHLWAAHLSKNWPAGKEVAVAVLCASLLVLSFPNFDAYQLAWIALAPLLAMTVRAAQPLRAFLLGWLFGTLFFYGSCYWLAYSLVHYGGIPAFIAYGLIVIPTLLTGLFPGLCLACLAQLSKVWGTRSLLAAPFLWAASEWARLSLTGQLWNAVAYSQAYHPSLIQAARWGGVYAVGFLILAVNAALAYMATNRTLISVLAGIGPVLGVGLTLWCSSSLVRTSDMPNVPSKNALTPEAIVIAVQPNVSMNSGKGVSELNELLAEHFSLSQKGSEEELTPLPLPRSGLTFSSATPGEDAKAKSDAFPLIFIWPESPMNFSYARDSGFREVLADFTRRNHASVLFNSLEPAPDNGAYNAAVMVDDEGRVIAQYDKIRLLPFGEYIPLPRWLPGVSLMPVMVGDFTPGTEYPLIPFGKARAGVFICFESAFPVIARTFTMGGADLLVNISNDGYFGPTPVMRQHLANSIFRAVENDRPVLRVTNSGISAYITPEGSVTDSTRSFEPAVRKWTASRATEQKTFYTLHGDLFAGLCALLSLMLVGSSFVARSILPRPLRRQTRVIY